MNTDLFNKIAKMLRDNYPDATDEFLMQQAREMYEAEMQRRSKLSEAEKFREKLEDIKKGK